MIKQAFDIQARHGSKQEVCAAVQQGLARYQDLPDDTVKKSSLASQFTGNYV